MSARLTELWQAFPDSRYPWEGPKSPPINVFAFRSTIPMPCRECYEFIITGQTKLGDRGWGKLVAGASAGGLIGLDSNNHVPHGGACFSPLHEYLEG